MQRVCYHCDKCSPHTTCENKHINNIDELQVIIDNNVLSVIFCDNTCSTCNTRNTICRKNQDIVKYGYNNSNIILLHNTKFNPACENYSILENSVMQIYREQIGVERQIKSNYFKISNFITLLKTNSISDQFVLIVHIPISPEWDTLLCELEECSYDLILACDSCYSSGVNWCCYMVQKKVLTKLAIN